MRYDAKKKLAAVSEVLAGASVGKTASKYRISRQSLRLWIARWQKNKILSSLANKYKKGSSHHNKLPWRFQKAVLEVVCKKPELGVKAIVSELASQGISVSTFAVWKILSSRNLQVTELRISYSVGKTTKTVLAYKIGTGSRIKAIEDYVSGKKNISTICRDLSITRKTFYDWLKRYVSGPDDKFEALRRRYVCGYSHPRCKTAAIRDYILEVVGQNPQFSLHKLHRYVLVEGVVVSHQALQNLLVREDLNTFAKRQLFAQGYTREQVQVAPLYEVPVPKLSVWRMLFAPFRTIPKWVIKHPISWPIVFPALAFLAYIFEADKLARPQMFFPIVALFFGFVFFLYSLKYYISLIIVMRLAQSGQKEGREGTEAAKGTEGIFSVILSRAKNLTIRSFGLRPQDDRVSRINPLLMNLDKVELEGQPFVSIHVAVYNEKRVIERLIEACKNQKWTNYEVILADDSTDETTEIIKNVLSGGGRRLENTFKDEVMEIFVSKPAKNEEGPIYKIIHRFSREGFKGAALQGALENTNPYADFVVVFDADFVPYADTIEQFVKAFQVLSTPGVENPIAAVQGYQWHVLNKSENWVTRGVRSEYAGSYVIERAGIGIYGGLNMIAGSVFCLRADVLRQFGWGKSITEDLELTLRLYEAGYKVAFTPYIQTPAEAVSTIKRLIRQRMRWAEGHTFNIRKMWTRIFASPKLNRREKFEFLYLSPYYLQAAFFIVGSLAWFIAEVVIHVNLPFWTAAWGWSLVFVNFLSLPLMNLIGLFLEESDERDYLGIASFVVLSYILVPFQAYAAVKALVEDSEGPWFRTPKTGNITDIFGRVRFYNWFEKLKIWPGKTQAAARSLVSSTTSDVALAFAENEQQSAFNQFSGYKIRPKRIRWVARCALVFVLISALAVNYLAFFTEGVKAQGAGPELEQKIEISDQTVSNVTSATYTPTDYSLGLINWDTSLVDGDLTLRFEAILNNHNSVGAYTSIACPASTDCKIAYWDEDNYDLRFTDCGDETCSASGRTTTLLDGRTDCVITNCSTSASVGAFSSIACPASTNCKISYTSVTGNQLAFIDCADETCSTGIKTILDGDNCVLTACGGSIVGLGRYTSIACPQSTNCKIAYNDLSSVDLHFADCDSETCTSGTVTRGVDSSGTAPWYTSIACPTSGNCKISYYDNNLGGFDLRFADCANETCSTSTATLRLLDGGSGCVLTSCSTSASVGQYTSIACPQSTNCKISYNDQSNTALKFADCGDETCSSGSVTTVASGAGSYGNYTSIACPTSGNCKISYQASSDLRFADCADETCSTSTATLQLLDGDTGCVLTPSCSPTANVGAYTSIACPQSTNCKIAYQDGGTFDLKFADCDGETCTSGTATVADKGVVYTAYAGLFNDAGTQVSCASGSQSSVEVSVSSANYTRQRTTDATCSFTTTQLPSDGYTARVKADGGRTYFKAARLVVIQSHASVLTKVVTQVEVGDYQIGFTNTVVATIGNVKRYCYDSDSTGTACAAAAPSNWSGTPSFEFHATLKNNEVHLFNFVYASLFDGTTTVVEMFSGLTTWNLKTAAVSLTAGKTYYVRVRCIDTVLDAGNTCSGSIANAKIVIKQNDSNGVSALETVQMYNNTQATHGNSTYTSQDYQNQFDPDNFSTGTKTYYFESTLFASAGTAYAQLYQCTGSSDCSGGSAVTSSEVTTTITSAADAERNRSGSLTMPSTAQDLTVQLKNSAASGNTTYSNDSWLIIQIASLPVPEFIIFALPALVFLPKIVSWWRRRMGKSKNLALVYVDRGG